MMMRNSNVVSRTFDQADVSKKFRDKPWADHLEYANVKPTQKEVGKMNKDIVQRLLKDSEYRNAFTGVFKLSETDLLTDLATTQAESTKFNAKNKKFY